MRQIDNHGRHPMPDSLPLERLTKLLAPGRAVAGWLLADAPRDG